MSVRTVDIAYDYLKQQNHSVSFKELWKVVIDQLHFDEKTAARKISRFYTDLTMDGRFATVENNDWDLKSHIRYQEINLQDDEDNEDEDEISIDDEEVDATIEDEY